MPKITKVYTRSGDDGTTGLGTGERVKKHSLRIAAFGTVDELNSQIGVAIAGGLARDLTRRLEEIQNELFHLGADLCVPRDDTDAAAVPRIEQRHVDRLESGLDAMTAELGPIENFILPGGSPGAARLHVARCVCRRAERLVCELNETSPVGDHVMKYLNRLSDALFVMARFENRHRAVPDVCWDSRR